MKLFRTLSLLIFLAALPALNAQSELTIEIVNLESNKGTVIVDLLDENEKTVADTTCLISGNKCTLVFKDLKNDQYAVRYIHDENGNDEIDTNILGIPKEGFGFSNDAFGKFGPKDFEEWLFTVSGNSKIIMTTRYL